MYHVSSSPYSSPFTGLGAGDSGLSRTLSPCSLASRIRVWRALRAVLLSAIVETCGSNPEEGEVTLFEKLVHTSQDVCLQWVLKDT